MKGFITFFVLLSSFYLISSHRRRKPRKLRTDSGRILFRTILDRVSDLETWKGDTEERLGSLELAIDGFFEGYKDLYEKYVLLDQKHRNTCDRLEKLLTLFVASNTRRKQGIVSLERRVMMLERLAARLPQ